MHRAISDSFAHGNTSAIARLIKEGVSPNHPRLGGDTFLHAAAHAGELELVIDLVKRGANPLATNSGSQTPIDLARQNQKVDVVAYLSQLVSSPTQRLTTEHP